MNFTVHTAEQRTPEWLAARTGKLTGSCAWKALDFNKNGSESAKRRDYRLQLVCERLTGLPQEDTDFVSEAMQRGIELEPAAFAAYEALTGNLAQRAGFLTHNVYPAGCSLDGQIDSFRGILEIKCPKTATHLSYWRGPGSAPADYLPQITHNLWVTGAEWCDFLSFDDRLPAELRTFLVRVKRSDVDLAGYEQKALAFLAEVDAEYRELSEKSKGAAVAV